jgi:hypothetical protein
MMRAPFDRVALHHRALAVGELARLVQHLERDARLAEIVQQPRHAERTHVARAHPHRLGERHRQHGDVERVRRRVLVELAQREQGRSISWSPCIATASERTTDSASSSGSCARALTCSCIHSTVATSSESS